MHQLVGEVSFLVGLEKHLVICPWHEAYVCVRCRIVIDYVLAAGLKGLDFSFQYSSVFSPITFFFALFMSHTPFPAYCGVLVALSTPFLCINLPRFLHTRLNDAIARYCSAEDYQAGELIFSPGDEADSFYVVTDGQVIVDVGHPPRPAPAYFEVTDESMRVGPTTDASPIPANVTVDGKLALCGRNRLPQPACGTLP